MKVTKEFLVKEAKKANVVLESIRMQAKVMNDSYGFFISVKVDLDNRPDPELPSYVSYHLDELRGKRFYQACDILQEYACLIEILLLEGPLLVPPKFKDLNAALAYAKKTKWRKRELAIRAYQRLTDGNVKHVFNDEPGNTYLMSGAEMKAAYDHARKQYILEDMNLALEVLIYGTTLEFADEDIDVDACEEEFCRKHGLSSPALYQCAEVATRLFLTKYPTVGIGSEPAEHWAMNAVKRLGKKNSDKEKTSKKKKK